MLVLEPDADDKADQQPLPIVAAVENSDDEEHDATQTRRSNVVVERRWPTAIATPEAAVASAATAWPARSAPSSRAIRATSTTTRAIAIADNIRSPRGSSPNIHSDSRPSSGVSAG